MNEFLNPKAMVTPGIAGTATMGITNTLAYAFGLPANPTALAVSFLFSGLALAGHPLSAVQRLLLLVLNGLVIFSVSVGANVAGRGVTGAATTPNQESTTLTVPAGEVPSEASDSLFGAWLGLSVDSTTIRSLRAEVVDEGWRGLEVSQNDRTVFLRAQPAETAIFLDGTPHVGTPTVVGNARTFTMAAEPQKQFFGDWFVKQKRIRSEPR